MPLRQPDYAQQYDFLVPKAGRPAPAPVVPAFGGVQIAGVLAAAQVLDFPNTAAQLSADLTIPVPGAAAGDVVLVGVPPASDLPDSCYTALVLAANVVTVRFNNYSAGAQDPASGLFTVVVFKFT